MTNPTYKQLRQDNEQLQYALEQSEQAFLQLQRRLKGEQIEMTELKPAEHSRTYFFPNGEMIELENVTHFAAGTTTHRLKTGDGKLHIVPMSGWLHIEIEADEWTL